MRMSSAGSWVPTLGQALCVPKLIKSWLPAPDVSFFLLARGETEAQVCVQPVAAQAGFEPRSEAHGRRPPALCTWLAQELDGGHLLTPPGRRKTFSRTGKGGCSFPSFRMVLSVLQAIICVILRNPELPVAGPPPHPLRLVGMGVEQGPCHPMLGTRARSSQCARWYVRPWLIGWCTRAHRGHAAAEPQGAMRLTGTGQTDLPLGPGAV